MMLLSPVVDSEYSLLLLHLFFSSCWLSWYRFRSNSRSFWRSTWRCVIVQLLQFICCVKFFISLTYNFHNFKMKIIFRFWIFYTFADKLVINLFIIVWIKIPKLTIRIISFRSKSTRTVFILLEQSKVRQTLSFLLASSIKSLLIHKDAWGIYLLVFLIQTPSRIFLTMLSETLAGKILKIFVCDKIVRQLDFSG